MSTTTCTACHDKPAHNAVICQSCADQLHADLHAIPDVVRDLNIEITGQARKALAGIMTSAPGFEQPLPLNVAASDALDRIRFELSTACMSVANGQRDRLPADWPDRPRISQMVVWLLRYEASVGLREDGGDICRGISSALRRARAICDNPPERRYIGECTCTDARDEPTRLYARMGEPVYQCRTCGTPWVVAERFAQLEEDLADYGLTQRELEQLLPTIPRTTLATWIDRGRLRAQGTSAEGEPAYRYGDVLALDARRRERGRKSA